MSKLNEFRDMINSIDDLETLDSGYDVLSDLIKISSLKQKIKKLESGLSDGGKAMFYFFAMGLDEEEIPFAAEKIKGRANRIRVKAEKENANNESKKEDEEPSGSE